MEQVQHQEEEFEAIHDHMACIIQRAWRTCTLLSDLEPVAAMHLERLKKYAPAAMKQTGSCQLCNGESKEGLHNCPQIESFQHFEAYFRSTVVPELEQLDTKSRKLQDHLKQFKDVKVWLSLLKSPSGLVFILSALSTCPDPT